MQRYIVLICSATTPPKNIIYPKKYEKYGKCSESIKIPNLQKAYPTQIWNDVTKFSRRTKG
jgi:hypothetical protein